MKKIKIAMASVAILLGLGAAFAFNAPAASKVTNQYWAFNGTGDPTQPASYTLTSGDPCSGSSNICEILAPANGSVPVISTDLKSRIENKDTSQHDVFLQD
ncbi:MAG: hypothetical protein JWR12_2981 [Mucilaginibacter sp.]|nr:hypothetical protein [Mucilaginibacter sp.]